MVQAIEVASKLISRYSVVEILPILKTICATYADVGGSKLVVMKYSFEPYKTGTSLLFQELLSKERSE